MRILPRFDGDPGPVGGAMEQLREVFAIAPDRLTLRNHNQCTSVVNPCVQVQVLRSALCSALVVWRE